MHTSKYRTNPEKGFRCSVKFIKNETTNDDNWYLLVK